MADPRVLILGHSFVHRLYSFIDSTYNPVLTLSLAISEPLHVKWHGIGGRTIAKSLAFDLHVVESFKPHVVILELGTNDLIHLDPTTVGSSLEDLTQVLYFRYGVQRIVVCQTIFRDKAPAFNSQVTILNKYLEVVIPSLPHAYFWKHRRLWNSSKGIYLKDGVHLIVFGQLKLYRSIRGAVLHSLRSLDLSHF